MQLDRKVVFEVQTDEPTNDSLYADEELRSDSCSFLSETFRPMAETMQESLGLQPIKQMAESLPIWRRLYMQWSKQLSQI